MMRIAEKYSTASPLRNGLMVITLGCILNLQNGQGLGVEPGHAWAAGHSAQLSGPHLRHPVEVPEAVPHETRLQRFGWILLASVTSLLLFCVGSDLYSGIRGSLMDRPYRLWNWHGIWYAAKTVLTLVPRSNQHFLVHNDQGFELIVRGVDWHGVEVSGAVVCSANGHEIGTFSLRPHQSTRNWLLLALDISDKPEQIVLRRPRLA